MTLTEHQEPEAAVSATGSSIDGRRLTFQCSVYDHAPQPGGYVSVGGRLGQVHTVEPGSVETAGTRIAVMRGTGVELDDGGRPRLARDTGREGDRGEKRARRALAPAHGARAGADRRRRGAQRLPPRAGRGGHRARDRVRRPHRGGGAEVRALPARLDPAAAPRERARRLAVRQPRADADDVGRQPGVRRGNPLVRAGGADCRSDVVPDGRVARRGKLASHPAFVRFGPRIAEEGGADVPANWAGRAVS